MIAWIICGILLILTIYFGVRLREKIIIDNTKLNEYQSSIDRLNAQKEDLNKDIKAQNLIIEENNEKIKQTNYELIETQSQYNLIVRARTEELDSYFEDLRAKRQEELDKNFEKAKQDNETAIQLQYADLINTYSNFERQAKERAECADRAANQVIDEAYDRAKKAIEGAKEEEEKFQAILAPLQQYEKEQQERLYYTIQVPDEYKEDIDFLLNTVSQKVQHPDIINKLVWAEYVKPYITETFKRADVRDESGIYKITNINNGKCYIGKSTNIKKRISDHFKSSIGISTIANQAVHHEILRTGFWNWTIEPIIYCDKDKLNEMEKYYIGFFKSNEFGYNRTGGGEG